MSAPPLTLAEPVTLVGGGELSAGMLAEARRIAPRLVAADGAADRLWQCGLTPSAIVGDLDSLADPTRWRRRGVEVMHIAEQETTDFEKCLSAVTAPLYIAAGFTGRRVDHSLVVLHAMLRLPERRIVVLGPEEAMALAPAGRTLALDLAPGARVSIYPVEPVAGLASTGLVWDIGGLAMAPGGRVGTSNIAAEARVTMSFDGPGALVMVERRFLATLVEAVR